MKPMSLSNNGFERKTKRKFLNAMKLVALIAPHVPAPEPQGGRPAFAAETTLRIHFLQQWFNHSDPAIEKGLCRMALFRVLVRLIIGEKNLPEEGIILCVHHLLEKNTLNLRLLATINTKLLAKSLMLKCCNVVDATLIDAFSPAKNSSGEHDPEMHQTRKGNQWNFGMNAHRRRGRRGGDAHCGGRSCQRERLDTGLPLGMEKKPMCSPMLATRV